MKLTLRMQGIQKNLLGRNIEELFSEFVPDALFHKHVHDKPKFTPVLESKSAPKSYPKRIKKLEETQPKSRRETSPVNSRAASKSISMTNSQYFKRSREASLPDSTSLDKLNTLQKIDENPASSPAKKHLNSSRKTATPSVRVTRERSRRNDKKTRIDIEKIWKNLVNSSNGIDPCTGSFHSYAVYVGKGNNALLVKRIFKTRPWWKFVESKDLANFVWCQWKDKALLSTLNVCNRMGASTDNSSLASQKKTDILKCTSTDGLGYHLIEKSKSYTSMACEKLHPEQQKLLNKLEFNHCLTNKKGLYMTMKRYYKTLGANVFDVLPLTFSVTSDSDEEFQEFLQAFQELESEKADKPGFQNIWIVKPGEFTNRGKGITVCSTLAEINEIIKPGEDKSYIVQKYIESPLLINKRKFDIRCYAMVTAINGVIQGYYYLDGYLRTSCKEFSVSETADLYIHLTNDAIQKHSTDYGKYENGNKLSYRDFQKYLDQTFPDKKVNFLVSVAPRIKEIVKDTVKASFLKIDKNRRLHCMEIFGYDFMLDSDFRPWLIEINTNPCIELSAPHLRTIIPAMLENAFEITVDCVFPPPTGQHLEYSIINRFELIFHQYTDGNELLNILGENKKYLEEE